MTENEQLKQQLWNIANTLRGKMGADDFRDYILGFIFYKYLSEKMHTYADKILKPDGILYADINESDSKGKKYLEAVHDEVLIDAYIFSGIEPLREDVIKCLAERPSILKARKIGEKIISKMKEYVQIYVTGLVA
jgi:type I restriction-modification system DNA methylase subunit